MELSETSGSFVEVSVNQILRTIFFSHPLYRCENYHTRELEENLCCIFRNSRSKTVYNMFKVDFNFPLKISKHLPYVGAIDMSRYLSY